MSFPTGLEWNQPGVEPPQKKKDEGWSPEEKPSAEFFNWLFNRICLSLAHLKENKVGVSDGQIDALALKIINLADGVEPTDAVNVRQFRKKASAIGRNYVLQGIPNGSGVQEAIRKQSDTVLEMPAGVLLNFAAGMSDYGPVDIVEKLETAKTITPTPADAFTIPLAYTEDLCEGGTPISSGDYTGYPKTNLFDNNPTTDWRSSMANNHANTAYIGYIFTTEKLIRLIKITSKLAVNIVAKVEIQKSSNSGSNWDTVIAVDMNTTANSTTVITLPATQPATYWRILAKSNLSNADWTIAEIEMMEALETHYVAAERNPETKEISMVATKNKPRVAGESNVTTIPGYYTADLCEGGTPISGGDYSGHPKTYAFDNDPTTAWWSIQQALDIGNAYIGYIFSVAKHIRRVVITLNNAGMGNVKIQNSIDSGITWNDVAIFSKLVEGINILNLPVSQSTTHWRIVSNGHRVDGLTGGGYQYTVDEIEMMEWVAPKTITSNDTKYTDNVCVGGVAISNGDYTGYPKENAFDGNNNTAWYSSQTSAGISGNASIGYDLGVARIIRKMQVIQGDIAGLHGITSVKVQNSSSGTTWNDVVTVTLESGLNNIDIPANAGARFWRILANANISGTGNAWFIHEITMREIATDLDYYDPISGVTKHFDGTSWTDKQRIYVGEIQVDSAGKIVKVTNYPIGVGNLRVRDAERKDEPVALGQLMASLNMLGYQKLPSGLIIQWGRSSAVSAEANCNITYPIAFPNTICNINCTAYVGDTSAASVANVVTYNNTGAILMNGDRDTNYPYIFWSAIGY